MKIDRPRKVDVSTLDAASLANIEKQLGKRLSDILARASQEANDLFGVYGLEVIMKFEVVESQKNDDNLRIETVNPEEN
jgi:hypothetical protein